jgi:hypothetical protein
MEMQLLTNTRQASRLTRLAIAAALALSLAVLAAPAAKASSPDVGAYNTGAAHCWDSNTIVAFAPGMTPAANFYSGSVVGGGQDVGFRVVLQRWNPSTGRWSDLVAGPWFGRTASYVVLGQGAEPWTFYDPVSRTNRISWDGNTYITMNGSTGYFRVTYDLYWYTNGKVSGSVLRAPADGHRDNRDDKVYVSGWSSFDWCRY